MKDQFIGLRLEGELLDDLTNEYVEKRLFLEISFSEYLRRKLKKESKEK